MDELTPEQMGLNYDALLRLIGHDKVLDLIGPARVITHFGTDKVLEALVSLHGIEKVRETFYRLKQESNKPDDSVPPRTDAAPGY